MKFNLLHFPRLGSTNDKALEFLENQAEEGLVIVADQQTSGRGRLGRRWVSQPGNLFASIVLRPHKPLQNLSEIAFVAALSVGHALNQYLDAPNMNLMYKWPNDILLGTKKVAGILIESYSTGMQETPEGCVVGIGVNMISHPEFTIFPSTNLKEFSPQPMDRDGLLTLILSHFSEIYDRWLTGGFMAIKEDLVARLYGIGRVIHATSSKGVIQGVFDGLLDDGSILLRDSYGQHITIRSSEVTFPS